MVCIIDECAKIKPAPAASLTSLTGKEKPLGAPFNDSSPESENCVFAMQTGRPPNH